MRYSIEHWDGTHSINHWPKGGDSMPMTMDPKDRMVGGGGTGAKGGSGGSKPKPSKEDRMVGGSGKKM